MKILRRIFLAITVLNVLLVTAAFIVKKITPQYGDPESDSFSVLAAMGGVDFSSKSDTLQSGSAMAFMGGVELDLTEATIVDGARLELKAIMGGIDVVVPSTWRVEMERSAFAGEAQNTTDPDGAAEDAPVLLVTANASCGGILVRSKAPEPVLA